MKMTLDRAHRQRKPSCDLGHREFPTVEEIDDLELSRLEIVQRRIQETDQHPSGLLPLHDLDRILRRHHAPKKLGVGQWTLLLEVVDPETTRDREDPGAEPKPLVESIEMSQDPHEGVLAEILGDVWS